MPEIDLTQVGRSEDLALAILAEPSFDSSQYRRYSAAVLRRVIEEGIFPFLDKDPLKKLAEAEVIVIEGDDGGGPARTCVRRLGGFPGSPVPVGPWSRPLEEEGEFDRFFKKGARGIYWFLDQQIVKNQNYQRAWGIGEGRELLVVSFVFHGPEAERVPGLKKVGMSLIDFSNLESDNAFPVREMLADVGEYLKRIVSHRETLFCQAKKRLATAETLTDMVDKKLVACELFICR